MVSEVAGTGMTKPGFELPSLPGFPKLPALPSVDLWGSWMGFLQASIFKVGGRREGGEVGRCAKLREGWGEGRGARSCVFGLCERCSKQVKDEENEKCCLAAQTEQREGRSHSSRLRDAEEVANAENSTQAPAPVHKPCDSVQGLGNEFGESMVGGQMRGHLSQH
eukprot:2198642-Rhodomonas_salina.1